MANISVRLNEQEEELFKTYAEFMDETLSTLFKKALLEKIEDEFDLKVGQKALAEYKQDPVTYSVAELEFSKRFDKQFSKLDKSTQRYLFNWLIKNVDNVENPRYSGKSLTGNKTGLWRYRIGNYRVIADINDGRCVILALEVGHRKDIYK